MQLAFRAGYRFAQFCAGLGLLAFNALSLKFSEQNCSGYCIRGRPSGHSFTNATKGSQRPPSNDSQTRMRTC